MVSKKKSIDEQFVKLEHIDHIKELPDTYVGSIEEITEEDFVFNEETFLMEKKKLTYIPALLKIYDEIIVNASDHITRTKIENLERVTRIDINITETCVSIKNNGQGIPVVIHKKENKYIPEMIFGDLLTSENYSNKEKIIGGRNGYGSKLTNIFSTEFLVETVDSINQKKFKQTFRNNMSNRDKPKITQSKVKPYTIITYTPDFKRFNIEKFSNDMIALMKKRAYDLSATSDPSVSVYLNNQKIGIKQFDKYVDYYVGDKKQTPRVYVEVNDRWKIAVCLSPDDKFEQISFVNGISTTRGGTHVKYISTQLSNKLASYIENKKKKKVKTSHIKDQMWIFINCIITNPSFTSQTKIELSSKTSNFGSKCDINDDFIQKVAKCGIIERAISFSDFKGQNELKKTDGKKKNRIRVPKLEDANFAGTSKSEGCCLILTEGDSAKTFAVSGLSIVGRDRFGVFPLKGKPLNVRDASAKQLLENEELKNIKEILGLRQGVIYKDTKQLRYSRVMICTDADVDGSHIKGLFINMISYFWPDLLKVDNFICSMRTPVVKATKGKNILSFYNLPEYEKWKKNTSNIQQFKIKYYKGLGTSSSNEAKEYFKNLDKNEINYFWNGSKSQTAILTAFDKQKDSSNIRKKWLEVNPTDSVLEEDITDVSIDNFIDNELKLFSLSDNIRSIPCICDGLKPSQRKILYSTLEKFKNSNFEIKVQQFGGYVGEKSSYHHGEASILAAIISMAQDFVGSNNINLLNPKGQFGTRLQGGKDASSPRYIFTEMNKLTPILFSSLDTPLLNRENDDGFLIEPTWYIPILPMILVNGSEGIGTGYSTFIPKYNPYTIILNLHRLMDGEEQLEMHPWYKNFNGNISKKGNNYITKGLYNISGDTLTITELPIGTWTSKYREFLDEIIIENDSKEKEKPKNKKGFIKDWNFGKQYTETKVHFIIQFPKGTLTKYTKNINDFEKKMKLISNLSTDNMWLYDKDKKIRKFNNPNQILKEFYYTRLEYYIKRKKYVIEQLKNEVLQLSSKARFIDEIIEEKLIVFRKKKTIIENMLSTSNPPYHKVDNNFDYLINMPINTFTEEKIEKLNNQRDEKIEKLNELEKTTEKQLWKNDLIQFINEYKVWMKEK